MAKPDPEPVHSEPIEHLTETSGTFESGVTYCYNEETKGLMFDGKGELSAKDYSKAFSSFQFEFIFFGKDVKSECYYGARFPAFTMTLVENWHGVIDRPECPIFTYSDSEFAAQFNDVVNELGLTVGEKAGQRMYYTVEDGTDPYTFVNTLEPLPEYIMKIGRLGDDVKAHWDYEGVEDHYGYFSIYAYRGAEPLELEDILEAANKYKTITTAYISLVGAR